MYDGRDAKKMNEKVINEINERNERNENNESDENNNESKKRGIVIITINDSEEKSQKIQKNDNERKNDLSTVNLGNNDLNSEPKKSNDNELNQKYPFGDTNLDEEQIRIIRGVQEAHRILTTTKRENGKPWSLLDASKLAKINNRTYNK